MGGSRSLRFCRVRLNHSLINLCCLMCDQLPAPALVYPNMQKGRMQGDIVPFSRKLHSDSACDYCSVSVDADCRTFKLDGMVSELSVAYGSDELRLGVGFSRGMSVGEIIR